MRDYWKWDTNALSEKIAWKTKTMKKYRLKSETIFLKLYIRSPQLSFPRKLTQFSLFRTSVESPEWAFQCGMSQMKLISPRDNKCSSKPNFLNRMNNPWFKKKTFRKRLSHTVHLQTILFPQQNYKQKQNGRNTVSDTGRLTKTCGFRSRKSHSTSRLYICESLFRFLFLVFLFSPLKCCCPNHEPFAQKNWTICPYCTKISVLYIKNVTMDWKTIKAFGMSVTYGDNCSNLFQNREFHKIKVSRKFQVLTYANGVCITADKRTCSTGGPHIMFVLNSNE